MNTQDHKQALPPGFRLGNYRMARVLGAGGFGVTYLCEHGGLGVMVAVKEYLPNDIAVRSGNAVVPKSTADIKGYQWGLRRFLDEARTLARFEHRNVVRVRDFFEANGTAYIVMDYEDGEPLDRVLERTGTLTEAQIKRLLLPIVAGLRQVHAAGFLHRDVKPANIFIRRSDESPVLLDFGSARQALGRLSRSVTAIASSGYSPPEQYESNGEQGPWTDIYALSALCYRAIAGVAPVESTRRQSRLLRGEDDPLPRLAEIARGRCSQTFLAAVDRGLRVVEGQRQGSLDEWWAELEGRTIGQPISHLVSPSARSGSKMVYQDPKRIADGRAEEPPKPKRRSGAWRRAGAVLIFTLVFGVMAKHVTVLYLRDRMALDMQDRTVRSLSADPVPGTPGRPPSESVPRKDGAAPGLVAASEADAQIREAAERGDAQAQNKLGTMYEYGEGVTKDYRQAALWYRRAAEQGFTLAQANLGAMYEYGDGVAQDYGQAVLWYGKAAEQGDAHGQNNLGLMYGAGRGVAQDDWQAALWYREAAEQGLAEAQHNLGVMYQFGRGVAQDDRQAVLWYREAAEQGYAQAQNNLGRMHASGEGVAQDNRQAVLWYRKAAEQGIATAQANLGGMYLNGTGVAQDDHQAVLWFRKATEQGLAAAQHNLGTLYEHGRGVAQDDQQAVLWYRKAAEQGDARGQNNLGLMYQRGRGVARDYPQAVLWYRKAAEQGFALAQYNLGLSHFHGTGLPKDAVLAYAWFSLAAAQGELRASEAKTILGRQMLQSQIAQAQRVSYELGTEIVVGNKTL